MPVAVKGIFNVLSSYDGSLTKEEWLGAIGDETVRQCAEAEFLYYEGRFREALDTAAAAMEKAQAAGDRAAAVGAAALLAKAAVPLCDNKLWESSIHFLRDSQETLPMLGGFMLCSVLSSLDITETAVDYLKEYPVLPEEYEMQLALLKLLTAQQPFFKLLGGAEGLTAGRSAAAHVYALIFRAIVERRLLNPAAARACLARAFEIAFPLKMYTPFAETALHIDNFFSAKCFPGYEKEFHLIRQLKGMILEGGMKLAAPEVIEPLTPKEFSAAYLASKGLRNKEIEKLMGVGSNTLKSYLKIAFQKLQVTGRKQLAAKFVPPDAAIKRQP